VENSEAPPSHALYQRPRKAGDLRTLKRVLWLAITQAERMLLTPETSDDRRLKAIHAISTASGVYLSLCKGADWEARLTAVEQALQQGRNGHHGHR
jgi:hypothetical protein